MLSKEQVGRGAELITEACAAGLLIEDLPPSCRPQTTEDAYAIQNHIFDSRNDRTHGWFVSATNPQMQRQLRLSEPYAARWGHGRFLDSNAEISAPGALPIALEAEVTFKLNRALPPRERAYTAQEVETAIAAVHPSFEVVISCFTDWVNQPPLNLIAEGGPAQLLVTGCGVETWQTLTLNELPIAATVNGSTIARGCSGNVMDGPVSVLVWLANHASNRGVGLEKGQLCNTGMCAPVFWVNPGDRAIADFGDLGTVEVEVGTYPTNNDAGAN